MRSGVLFAICLLLAGCHGCGSYNNDGDRIYYEPQAAEEGYVPAKGRVFHAAGFDIKEGQQMRDFFDEFEEPMHAKYMGKENIRWVYYIDYNAKKDKGKIVRYCELEKYKPHSLCELTVDFYKTYVTNAVSNCK